MRFFIALIMVILPLIACAESKTAKPEFVEGQDYTVIPGQPKPPKTGKITATEFYWYGCGHCYKFESLVKKWKKTLADDVEFSASPAIWRPAMRTHAKLYYTAQSMGVLDKLHQVFFESMHLKGMRLVDLAEIEKVVSEHGVDGKVFVSTMESFAVDAQVKLADSRQKNFRISATPEMVVADYYHVKTKGSQKRMLEVVDFLIEKLRSER